MKRRLSRLLLAALTLNAALLAGALAAPGATFACVCAPEELGEWIPDGSEAAVLAGVVGAQDERGLYAFAVTRWYQGGSIPAVKLDSGVRFQAGGMVSGSSCDAQLTVGSHVILVAEPWQGALRVHACSIFAELDTAAGQEIQRTARTAFGEGIVPGAPTPGEVDPVQELELASVAILVAAALFGLVVLGVVTWIAIGRPGRREPPGTATR